MAAQYVLGPWACMLLTGTRGATAVNAIGDAGAAAIAEALKVNKAVTTICLHGTCRAARGAR